MHLIIKEQSDLNEQEMEDILEADYISIDTETTGLDFLNHDLCTIQLYSTNYSIIIRYSKTVHYENLIKILTSKNIIKVFHNAFFDCSFLMHNLGIVINNVVCTKISAKIINGINADNSLKGLLFKYLGVKIDKSQQLSDWTSKNLSQEQINYAMNDVLYLHELWLCLESELVKYDLINTAKNCFEYIPTYVMLIEKGIKNIFEY
mgnify:CR=1 FL=1